jgi:spoIIIJ-associated protein
MAAEKNTVEIHADTVDEAISKGLEEMGVGKNEVSIEILDKGGRGLFGLGGHPAHVKLVLKEASLESEKIKEEELVVKPSASVEPIKMTADEDHEIQVARVVVEALIEKMKVRARVKAKYLEPDPTTGEKTIFIEILGDDLSILIGRRSETLNAIQYISSLIISRELNKWVPFMIDVQGYRERRERQLKLLAKRMAEQAISTGRRQILEPMPANERRVIHIELREHPDVETSSIGEEPNRKVTVFPKSK